MKMEEELVSIIMPVYNSERYIGEAIESVIAQTYKNWEMIIVDDCSTDGTRDVIRKYLDDIRICYICLERNSGAAKARNSALEYAKSRFITFLDADDFWKTERIEKQMRFIRTNGYGFTFSGYEILRKGQSKIISVPSVLDYSGYMKNTTIAMMTVLIDTNIVGKVHFVDVRKDQDSMTWAAILKKGYKAYGLNESLAYYRKVSGSISNNKLEAMKNHWNNCRKIEKIPFSKCMYYFLFYIKNAIKKNWF